MKLAKACHISVGLKIVHGILVRFKGLIVQESILF